MDNKQFNYTYTAPTEKERREIERIREAYAPKEQNKSDMEKLKKLDAKVHRFPMILALTLGVAGTLIFGLGLSMILEMDMLIVGSCLAVGGLIPLALAYPAYRATTENRKKKYGAEILALSEKLLNETENA
ncbi:MAG: hypothetical protein IJX91_01145 [Clostridia bacterium]|nr:hypothetical protein [Clostridia bacterium]